MKQQYNSPRIWEDILSLEHFLQTESVTGMSGDLGYQGPGSGGGRGKERDDIDDLGVQDDALWGDLW